MPRSAPAASPDSSHCQSRHGSVEAGVVVATHFESPSCSIHAKSKGSEKVFDAFSIATHDKGPLPSWRQQPPQRLTSA